jgi:ribulose bisphosphate carboxylase small subunit
MIIFTLASLFLIGCTQGDEEVVETSLTLSTCDIIVDNMTTTQQIRDAMKKDFEITREFYETKSVSKTTWETETSRWLMREEELSIEMDSLFEEASKMGCVGIALRDNSRANR